MTDAEYQSILKVAQKNINEYIEMDERANYNQNPTRKEDYLGYWVAVEAQRRVKK